LSREKASAVFGRIRANLVVLLLTGTTHGFWAREAFLRVYVSPVTRQFACVVALLLKDSLMGRAMASWLSQGIQFMPVELVGAHGLMDIRPKVKTRSSSRIFCLWHPSVRGAGRCGAG
jgi:hypothetical protein